MSAFGFGGRNFHCLLEEADPVMPGIDWGGDVQILAYSGRDAAEIEASLPRWTDDVSWLTVRQEGARSRERFRSDDPSRLVLAHDDCGQEARLQVAIDITRAIGGHLTCLDVAMTSLVSADFTGTYAGTAIMAQERQAEAANRATLKMRLDRDDISHTVIDATGDAATCLRRAAKLADLVVVNLRVG